MGGPVHCGDPLRARGHAGQPLAGGLAGDRCGAAARLPADRQHLPARGRSPARGRQAGAAGVGAHARDHRAGRRTRALRGRAARADLRRPARGGFAAGGRRLRRVPRALGGPDPLQLPRLRRGADAAQYPGLRRAADPQPAGRLRRGRMGRGHRGLLPPHGGSGEGGLRRPRRMADRPRARGHPARTPAVEGIRRRAPPADRPPARAGQGRARRPLRRPCATRGARWRHLLFLRRGRRRAGGFADPVDLPRLRLMRDRRRYRRDPAEPRLVLLARCRASQLPCTGQADLPHPGAGDAARRRCAGACLRHHGRRRPAADPGRHADPDDRFRL